MTRIFSAGLVAVTFASSLGAGPLPSARSYAAQATVGAQRAPVTLFFDDFLAGTLDRTKWDVIVTGRTVNDEQQAYIDSADTIDFVSGADAPGATNGALALRARYRPGFTTSNGRAFDFVSGRLETGTKFQFTYGTAAARIKLTAGSGLWPAFWALGAGAWPATGEIDIMENVGDSTWTNVALHGPGYSGNTPLVQRRLFPGDNDITAWHVYSVDWTADALTFKVDDQVFYSVTKADVEKFGKWSYDNPKHLIVNLAVGGAYPKAINKAEQPYLGLTQPTVDLIKRGQAVMLVDWIRVTR